ncbi:MAG: hypothetical protein PUB93_06280 [Firmicutes bacterium]|nr:hypothetical protein [Bacillota bacterium]
MEQATLERLLSDKLNRFLHRQERVLICAPGQAGEALAEAVEGCGGKPVTLGADLRWKSLLRLAFSSRASAVIGSAEILLGLRKVAKATMTPLFIRNVVLPEGQSPGWMREDISRGLDCRIWEADALPREPLDEGQTILQERLLSWSGILDFRIRQTESGSDLEVVSFSGEKLPRLPSCAKLTLRSWDPERDIPFCWEIR